MLSGLSTRSGRGCRRPCAIVERLIGGAPEPEIPYTLRPHQVGDIGWITHRQGLLYAQEYGWDETFEALVAEIAATFVKNFDPEWERCWVAERGGDIVGSVFLVRHSNEVAKLRLLMWSHRPEGSASGGGSSTNASLSPGPRVQDADPLDQRRAREQPARSIRPPAFGW